MNIYRNIILCCAALSLFAMGMASCQNFEESPMAIVPDPPYSPLVYYLTFDKESIADSSLYEFPVQGKDMTFVEGVSGTAIQGARDRYVLIDTLVSKYHGVDLRESLSEMEGCTFSCWMNLKKEDATGGIALFSIPNRKGSDWLSNFDILIDAPNLQGALPVALHVETYRTGSAQAMWVAKDNTPEIYMKDMLDRWVHLVIRYSGKSSTVTYFKDGQKIFSKTYNNFGMLKFANTGAVLVGAFQNMTTPKVAENASVQGWESNFPGQLDQVRFYNKFLTDRQVRELFNSKR